MALSQDVSARVLPDPLAGLIGAYEASRLIASFVEVGAADRLADGPATVNELALDLDLHAGTLGRVVRALEALRIVDVGPDETVTLTKRGARLAPGGSDSMNAFARAVGQPWWWASWGRLADALRTGRSGFSIEHGHDLYSALETDADAARVYGNYMCSFEANEFEECATHFDWSTVRSVVDVGGGQGALLLALLGRHSHLEGTVADRPAAVAAAQKAFAEAGLEDRAKAVAADFFVAVPSGADAYVMRHVLHDWDDEAALRLLRRVREAMPDHGTLLVIQEVISEAGGSSRTVFLDIALLVLTGGRERSMTEFRLLLEQAGFLLHRTEELPSGASLIEARPA